MGINKTLDVLNFIENNIENNYDCNNAKTEEQPKERCNFTEEKIDEGFEQVYHKISIDENTLEFFTNIDGKIDGNLSIKNKEGEIITILAFSNGLLNGKATFYFNGNIIREEQYKDGIKNGVVQSFHENGEVSSIENYKDGKLSGTNTKFYNSGQIFEEMTYTNGKIEGQLTRYFPDGSLMEECSYANGQKNGHRITYNPNGSVKSVEDFS